MTGMEQSVFVDITIAAACSCITVTKSDKARYLYCAL